MRNQLPGAIPKGLHPPSLSSETCHGGRQSECSQHPSCSPVQQVYTRLFLLGFIVVDSGFAYLGIPLGHTGVSSIHEFVREVAVQNDCLSAVYMLYEGNPLVVVVYICISYSELPTSLR